MNLDQEQDYESEQDLNSEIKIIKKVLINNVKS